MNNPSQPNNHRDLLEILTQEMISQDLLNSPIDEKDIVLFLGPVPGTIVRNYPGSQSLRHPFCIYKYFNEFEYPLFRMIDESHADFSILQSIHGIVTTPKQIAMPKITLTENGLPGFQVNADYMDEEVRNFLVEEFFSDPIGEYDGKKNDVSLALTTAAGAVLLFGGVPDEGFSVEFWNPSCAHIWLDRMVDVCNKHFAAKAVQTESREYSAQWVGHWIRFIGPRDKTYQATTPLNSEVQTLGIAVLNESDQLVAFRYSGGGVKSFDPPLSFQEIIPQ